MKSLYVTFSTEDTVSDWFGPYADVWIRDDEITVIDGEGGDEFPLAFNVREVGKATARWLAGGTYYQNVRVTLGV